MRVAITPPTRTLTAHFARTADHLATLYPSLRLESHGPYYILTIDTTRPEAHHA